MPPKVVHSEDPLAQRGWELLFGERAHDAVSLLEAAGAPENTTMSANAMLVSAYRLSGRSEEAETLCWSLTQSGTVDPMNSWRLGFELACLYAQKGQLQDAIALYQDLLSQVPDHPRCLSNLHQIAVNIGDGAAQDQIAERLVTIAQDENSPGRFYAYLALHKFAICDDPAKNLAINRLRSRQLLTVPLPSMPSPARPGGAKPTLRIGYLGEPFRDHARAHLLTGVLEQHDRERFHISAFSTGPDDNSAARKRLENAVDVFHNLQGVTDEQVTAILCDQALDVLVVTDGWNHGHRMAALAAHPVPVQIGYLGNPCTSGADFIDYMIVDPHIAPPGDEEYFSETLIRLAGTYQATDNKQPLPGMPGDREEQRRGHGLPADAIVFASFNQTYKLDRTTMALWFGILREVPHSVLWLLDAVPEAKRNLSGMAQKAGVEASRLVYAPNMAKAAHIERLALADIGLDPLICNGHTTTTDALWAGVPVVARHGRHFASRVAASVLSAAGADQLVTHSVDEYHRLAVRLARDPEALKQWRQKLVAGRHTSRLFDTTKHTRLLEQAYSTAYEQKLSGLPPTAITIS